MAGRHEQNSLSLPIFFEFKHDGFWVTSQKGVHETTDDENCDRNSVMISKECLLYVYKLALRHYLLSQKVISPSEIDAANLVTHVVIRKNKNDPFSKYKKIDGEKFLVTKEMLSSKTDFLMIELDTQRDLHMTLIYSKKIGRKINLIEAFEKVLKTLNQKPELVDDYKNLRYFGQDEAEWWYETGHLWPNNVKMPQYYTPTQKLQQNYTTTKAGSVIF